MNPSIMPTNFTVAHGNNSAGAMSSHCVSRFKLTTGRLILSYFGWLLLVSSFLLKIYLLFFFVVVSGSLFREPEIYLFNKERVLLNLGNHARITFWKIIYYLFIYLHRQLLLKQQIFFMKKISQKGHSATSSIKEQKANT